MHILDLCAAHHKTGKRGHMRDISKRLIAAAKEGVATDDMINAAPDMYQALKNLENDDGKRMPRTAWELVCRAIGRAEGRL